MNYLFADQTTICLGQPLVIWLLHIIFFWSKYSQVSPSILACLIPYVRWFSSPKKGLENPMENPILPGCAHVMTSRRNHGIRIGITLPIWPNCSGEWNKGELSQIMDLGLWNMMICPDNWLYFLEKEQSNDTLFIGIFPARWLFKHQT